MLSCGCAGEWAAQPVMTSEAPKSSATAKRCSANWELDGIIIMTLESDARLHETMLVELPVLVAVRAEPLAGVVMPLVGEAHGDAVAVEGPQFLDEPVVELLVPFAREELHDGLAPLQELRAIAPHAVRGVGER